MLSLSRRDAKPLKRSEAEAEARFNVGRDSYRDLVRDLIQRARRAIMEF